jgi:hypothetical protein
VKTYIKIYGPPVLPAIKALEKIAIDVPEVCIMNPILGASLPTFTPNPDALSKYFTDPRMTPEQCSRIVSKSGESLGDYDFFFEWYKDATRKDLDNLVEKIDNALLPLGCRYTIITK